ncbi:cupin domain-containing protein [Sphingosinicella microcystinivorans]|nr:cupin domain-containing protein [Sphingosinicella microcystinivorans]RKS85434.1 cupin domain [Sphingosinicella microcystinivorans]
MDAILANFEDMDWFDVRDGVRRKAFSGDGATIAMHELLPGHEPRPHDHPYEQIVYVAEGEMDFHVGGKVHRLTKGGLLVIPPNVRHHGVVVGDRPAINIDIFTPRRAEYA